MKIYSQESICVKCWAWSYLLPAKTGYERHIPWPDYAFWREEDDLPVVEFIKRTCQRCWYIWTEKPLDEK